MIAKETEPIKCLNIGTLIPTIGLILESPSIPTMQTPIRLPNTSTIGIKALTNGGIPTNTNTRMRIIFSKPRFVPLGPPKSHRHNTFITANIIAINIVCNEEGIATRNIFLIC